MDPHAVFDALDDNMVPVFTLATLAMIGNYIWFAGAIAAQKRDKVYAIPLFLTFFWFAHDSSYVLHYDRWFNQYDHWFPQLFWALIIVTVAFEIYYMSQTLRLGHRELAAGLTVTQFRAGFFLCLAAMYVAWLWLQQSMQDPIYLDIFALTVLSYPCLAIAMMLRRGDRRGFNATMCAGFLMMTVCYFTASTFFFGPYFQRWEYAAVGIASLTCGIAMTWVYRQLPPAPSTTAVPAERTEVAA
ncbi:hypothetical protein F0U44_06195 [Nocardioides humilatus]|uniref:Uncharacterized protein n=1 Tax=Nocardioides humilatus TaxID=2607660 RepID=A0A5B1LMZ5_9ACTN|nr:hypothetical protein [Nocardioides humilatus]KAA1421856.1 hypothetical protein F0U44_06195 [Nocardioides humilatus]